MVSSERDFVDAYRRRPVMEVTPEMVAVGVRVLRAGLEATAARVFTAMMEGRQAIEVTPRMKQTAAELIFLRPDFDGDRVVSEMLEVMLQESRSGPDWRSQYATERAIPRAIEMLVQAQSAALDFEFTDGMILRGREALIEGLHDTAKRMWHAVVSQSVELTPAMEEAGLAALMGSEGQEADSIVANTIEDMVSEGGFRCVFPALESR